MKFVIAACLLIAAQFAFASTDPLNLIRANDATYLGLQTFTGRQFLGIRYAQAPTGPLRWMPPKRISPTSLTRPALTFGNVCLQALTMGQAKPGDLMRGSEDCLYLNVYESLDTKPGRPVMVWIHGGAYTAGAGSDYDAHLLAERNNIIVVTLNYRLGALGFLSVPQMGPAAGNFGLLDQQAALKWVQRNIKAFGGDPSNVTIFGESAGGHSVCSQLLSPMSKGLYARGIIESGLCGTRDTLMQPRTQADRSGLSLAQALRCPTTKPLECLRKQPALAILMTNAVTFNPGLGLSPWTPVHGTKVIPEGASAFERGDFNRVPLIQGSNHDEGRLFGAIAFLQGHLKTTADYENFVTAADTAHAPAILAHYPSSNFKSPFYAYSSVITDAQFSCPALAGNDVMSRYTRVYGYEFNDRSAPTGLILPPEISDLGAFHASEIQYIFQTKLGFAGNPALFSPDQQRLADRMQDAWVSFARDGIPTFAGKRSWTPARPGSAPIQNFDLGQASAVVGSFAEDHQCAFWNSLKP